MGRAVGISHYNHLSRDTRLATFQSAGLLLFRAHFTQAAHVTLPA